MLNISKALIGIIIFLIIYGGWKLYNQWTENMCGGVDQQCSCAGNETMVASRWPHFNL